MATQFHFLQIPIFIATILSVTLAIYLWRQRHNSEGAFPLAVMMLALSIWSASYFIELISPHIIWSKFAYIGVVITPLAWLIFSLDYIGKPLNLNGKWGRLLLLHPLIVLSLVWTNEWHHLIWQTIDIQEQAPLDVLAVTYGIGFFIHAIYSYGMLLTTTALLVGSLLRYPEKYRQQAWTLLSAVAAPLLGNLIYLLGISYVDLTTVGFAITGLALTWGLFKFQLLDLIPVARQSVLNNISTSLIILDKRRRVLDINQAACQFLGITRDKAIGMLIDDVFAPWRDVVEKYRGLEQVHEEILVHHPQERYFDLKISTIKNHHGEMQARIILFEDITHRKTLEINLRRQALVFENIADGIVITNLHDEIIDCNPAIEKMFGYSKAELIGQKPTIWNTQHIYQDLLPNIVVSIGQTGRWHGELPYITKDGRTGINEVLALPLFDDEGVLMARLGVNRDVTQRKQTEQFLRQAKEDAEAASLAKSSFLANMSHELRTPLTAIIGYTELIESELGEVAREITIADLKKIQLAGKHLLDVIRDVLDLAKIEAGEMEVYAEDFRAEELVNAIQATVGYLIQQNNNTLELFDPAPLGVIHSDPTRVRQMLLNLISNAAKFTHNGTISLSGERIEKNGQEWIYFHVKDTGVGIPPEKLERIFEAFVQADGSNTRQFGGSGLGLTITRYYAKLLGGTISVTSEMGKGSTFTIKFPARYHPEAVALVQM